MLTEIILKDYTTFINKTIFDFNASNSKILDDTNVGDNRVLKGALFVGENASGKTQILNAIRLLLNLLLSNVEENFELKKSLYTKGNKYNLIYVFNVDNNIIKYDIEFDKNIINSEKLYVNDKIKIDRIKNNGKIYLDSERDANNISDTLSLVRLEYYNTRFNNDTTLNKWFNYLKNSIYVNCLFGRTECYDASNLSELVLEKYVENNNESKLNNFMNKLGYNSEVIFKKSNNVLTGSNDKSIYVRKKGTNVDIPLSLESVGNKCFVNIILPILYSISNDCIIIIDEFSSGLHNELEESLIKFFFNNSKNSQLFFTSHSTNILDTSILRPDQIYSFKFDSKYGTIIKKFSEENPRESQNLEKMYINGVFNGMPKYNKEFKN